MDLTKHLHSDKQTFKNLSHHDLVELVFEYKEAYKRSTYDRKYYKDSLEIRIDNLTKKIEELTNKINDNKDFEKLYKSLRIKKLSFKERLKGYINI